MSRYIRLLLLFITLISASIHNNNGVNAQNLVSENQWESSEEHVIPNYVLFEKSLRKLFPDQVSGARPDWRAFAEPPERETIDSIWESRCPLSKIEKYARGVVRLHVPKGRAECEIRITDTRDTEGCTAWRFSESMFITAWHCLADQMACEGAEIHFGYEPEVLDIRDAGNEFLINSINWIDFSEECEDIVYSNSILDTTIFTVTKENYKIWGKEGEYPEYIPIASIPKYSYPNGIEVNDIVISDSVFMLHYPTPGDYNCRNILARDRRLRLYSGYQMERQISFPEKAGSFCRLYGDFINGQPSTRTPVVYDPYGGACDRYLPIDSYTGPFVGVHHRCDTCKGSSGAPIISLGLPGYLKANSYKYNSDYRKCKVIAMHIRGFPKKSYHFEEGANVGVRFSALGECIDFERSQSEDDIILRNENMRNFPECLSLVPKNIYAPDCRERSFFDHNERCRKEFNERGNFLDD